jgi:DUF971 family protein
VSQEFSWQLYNEIADFRNSQGTSMSMSRSENLQPVSLAKEGGDRLVIQWKDGHRSVYSLKHLRDNCPCAGCREERVQPPDPFRILKPSEMVPLAITSMTPIGHYAYKITWSDGHDTGIYTLESLRELCQCAQCRPPDTKHQ